MLEVDIAATLLRLGLGGVMLAHGWNHLWGPGGIDGTAGWFASMGLRPARLQALASGSIELLSGAFLLLGLLTTLMAAAVVGVMAVAFMTAHRTNGFFIFKPGQGYEYVGFLALTAVALAGLGPGRLAVDDLIGLDLAGGPGAALAAGLGLAGAAGLLVTCWRPEAKA